jgi:hypothetical protein
VVGGVTGEECRPNIPRDETGRRREHGPSDPSPRTPRIDAPRPSLPKLTAWKAISRSF